MVTGREGSVRYQKRFGSIFTLKVNKEELSYEYSRCTHQIDSRSGHSSEIVPSFSRSARKSSPAVLVMGGRKCETIDSIPLKSFTKIDLPDYDEEQLNLMNSLRFKLTAVKPSFRLHASLVINNWVILHGGRVFNKMRNDVLGTELIIYDSSSSRWYSVKIKSSDKKIHLKRFGHSLSSINGKLYMLGGALNDDECVPEIIELEFKPESAR